MWKLLWNTEQHPFLHSIRNFPSFHKLKKIVFNFYEIKCFWDNADKENNQDPKQFSKCPLFHEPWSFLSGWESRKPLTLAILSFLILSLNYKSISLYPVYYFNSFQKHHFCRLNLFQRSHWNSEGSWVPGSERGISNGWILFHLDEHWFDIRKLRFVCVSEIAFLVLDLSCPSICSCFWACF